MRHSKLIALLAMMLCTTALYASVSNELTVKIDTKQMAGNSGVMAASATVSYSLKSNIDDRIVEVRDESITIVPGATTPYEKKIILPTGTHLDNFHFNVATVSTGGAATTVLKQLVTPGNNGVVTLGIRYDGSAGRRYVIGTMGGCRSVVPFDYTIKQWQDAQNREMEAHRNDPVFYKVTRSKPRNLSLKVDASRLNYNVNVQIDFINRDIRYNRLIRTTDESTTKIKKTLRAGSEVIYADARGEDRYIEQFVHVYVERIINGVSLPLTMGVVNIGNGSASISLIPTSSGSIKVESYSDYYYDGLLPAQWEKRFEKGSNFDTYFSPEAVDLGVKVNGKNIKWASFNLGASLPEESGLFFSWGETDTKKEYFGWSTYKWCDGTENSLTKYNTNNYYGKVDNLLVLKPEDDAAHVYLGDSWRMPTKEEWLALIDQCQWKETKRNGVIGGMVTGPNGNAIFLPAAGYRWEGATVANNGKYWASSIDTYEPCNAFIIEVTDSGDHIIWVNGIERFYGMQIRPVYVE